MKFKHSLLCATAAALLFSCKPKENTKTSTEPVMKNTAENAVKSFRQAVLDSKGGQIWNQLPDSYQKDLNFVVQDFATTLDPAIYKQSVDILTSLNTSLKSKKELLIEYIAEKAKSQLSKEEITSHFEVTSKVLDSLVTSDFNDLEKVKKINLGPVFEKTLSPLLSLATEAQKSKEPHVQQIFAALKSTSVKVISETELETILEMTVPAHGEQEKKVENVAFNKVEGKWLPKEMADGWKKGIEGIKENIAKMKTPEAKQKQAGTAMMLMMAKGFTDQLANVKTKEELEALLGSIPLPGLNLNNKPKAVMPPHGM